MDINIRKIEERNKFEDARPKIREVAVRTGLPKALGYWSAASRWALILFAALAPVFFLPFTNLPVAANKELLIFVLILTAFFALLGRILIEGRFRYPGRLLTLAFLVLVLVWAAAAFFSINQFGSLLGSWATPDSFFAVLFFSVLALSIATTFDRRDIVISLLAFLASLSFLGLFELLQLLKIFILPFSFAKSSGFNPVGSINDAGALLAFGLVIVSGLMASPDLSAQAGISKLLKRLLGLAAIIFILNLAVIDFWAIWVGLALAMIFMISSVKAWLPSIILLVSLLFLFIPSPLARFVQTPVEVSPSFSATFNIAVDNLRAGHYLSGSGPNTFGYIFNLYKPIGINQTIFWSTVFNSGASAMATWLGTMGILGVLALFFLIFAFLWVGIAFKNAVSQAVFAAVSFLFIMWFLYAANFTVMAFAFWGIGLFLAASSISEIEESRQRRDGMISEIKRKSIFKEIRIFTSPPKTFLFSLLIIVLMVGAAAGIYFEANRYIAEIYFSKNSPDLAIGFWQYDERYFQGLSQAVFLQLNDLLAQKDLPQETLKTQFQNITANSIAAAKQAQNLDPNNPFNGVLLGNIYENLIPYISDASGFALSAYSNAAALDPQNPSNYLALARVKIAKEDLDGAIADLEKSIGLKNDYAPARFLLVQVFDRQGKLADAIKRAEELVALNNQDVGALFQLGFLYYKNNQFNEAKQVFEKTIQLSPNYSNARYFLGLIYDGSTSLTASERKSKALEEFRKIAELNPDNAEIKQIVANLEAKKPALSGIAPPAPAPQSRSEAPVQEGTTAPVQKLQK